MEKGFDELQGSCPESLAVCLGAEFISLAYSMHTNLNRMKLEKGKNLPKQSSIQIHINEQMKRGREQREKDLNEKLKKKGDDPDPPLPKQLFEAPGDFSSWPNAAGCVCVY